MSSAATRSNNVSQKVENCDTLSAHVYTGDMNKAFFAQKTYKSAGANHD